MRSKARPRAFALAATLVALIAAACAEDRAPRRETVVVASTTSTEDTGLFDVLVPAFEAAHPRFDVRIVAVGTGEALALGRRKDADVVLVHDPAAEEAFVAEGHGTERREVMYNDFVVAGPSADPAGVRGLSDAVEAFRRIAASGAPFVSRGDDSGTHRKERRLWTEAGIDPAGSWYVDAGQGMAETLRIASELGAYLLTDRATYLFLRDRLELDALAEGDPRLYNVYGVIPVAGARNFEGGRAFAEWITSPEAQALIAGYGVDRFGRPLFVPIARR
jgi:tungstate transport system substrate-binding protein